MVKVKRHKRNSIYDDKIFERIEELTKFEGLRAIQIVNRLIDDYGITRSEALEYVKRYFKGKGYKYSKSYIRMILNLR